MYGSPYNTYKQVPKEEPMPTTVEAFHHHCGLVERALLRQDAEISRLKQKINKLEQKIYVLQTQRL